MILETKVADQAASESFAGLLSTYLKAGDLIAFEGELGAGKTVLARALIRALLDNPAIEVPSPTFTLVQTYAADDFEIWHADLYRLNDEEEVYELGLDEAKVHSICLVEWPDRMPLAWQTDALKISLQDVSENDDARIIQLMGNQDWQERLKGLVDV